MQDTSQDEQNDMYSQLMMISEEALVSAYYETAYHALSAAMHYAQSCSDEQRLCLVEQTAKKQQDWVDTHAPEHRMSTQSTTKRHGVSLYDMLARQSSAQVLILHQKHRRDSAKSLPWPGDEKDELF